MKPFNLEAAKAGAKLVTRDGREVSEFHHFETDSSSLDCVVVVDGKSQWVRSSSGRHSNITEATWDLFLAPTKRTVYLNMWRDSNGRFMSAAYDTEHKARINSDDPVHPWLKLAHPIEIEC